MAKKYKECMDFMVYEIFETGVKAGIINKPMYVLRAQFDEKDDAELFIEVKTKKVNKKYLLFENDENKVVGEFA